MSPGAVVILLVRAQQMPLARRGPESLPRTLAHVIRGEIGQAEFPMKPDHRLPSNLLVEAERSEPLSRIHDEFGNAPALEILVGLGELLQCFLVFSAHRL